MSAVIVDTNVLLDVLEDDPQWYGWSSEQLATAADAGELWVNPVIYAEVSVGFQRIEELEESLPVDIFRRMPFPWEAAFLAGKAFVAYRRRGGMRTSPLPDFFIGAHAAIAGVSLLTRDAGRYRTYFPKIRLICPE